MGKRQSELQSYATINFTSGVVHCSSKLCAALNSEVVRLNFNVDKLEFIPTTFDDKKGRIMLPSPSRQEKDGIIYARKLTCVPVVHEAFKVVSGIYSIQKAAGTFRVPVEPDGKVFAADLHKCVPWHKGMKGV